MFLIPPDDYQSEFLFTIAGLILIVIEIVIYLLYNHFHR
jgi:hypothetical protein